ncbi:MAG TPA: SOS response-associated peptidase family protein [Edaphocola sp.]|nr:SOS response-associated peptidase family protein [Edaphocola sp.]
MTAFWPSRNFQGVKNEKNQSNMCNRVATPGERELSETPKTRQYSILESFQEQYHVNGFARPFLPCLLNNAADSITLARWKFIPPHIQNDEGARKFANTLNARGEELFEKPTFRAAASQSRGLLFVKGFWEPHKVKGKRKNDSYFIYMPQQQIFALGIVYSEYTDSGSGVCYPTFAIVTCAPNKELSFVHNEGQRMPLILAPEDWEQWLFAETKEEVSALIRPYKDGVLQYHKTMPVYTMPKAELNIPEVQAPYEAGPEYVQGSLFD